MPYIDKNGQLQMTPEERAAQEEQAGQIMAKNGGQDVTFQAPQPQMPAASVKSPSVPPEIMKSLAFSSTITPEQVAQAKASSDAAAADYKNSEAGVSPMSRIVSALGAALPMIFSKGVGGKYGIQGYENAQDVLVKNAAMEQKRRSEIMDTENRNYDQLLRQQQLEATNKANWENKDKQHQERLKIQEERNRIMERNGYVLDPETGQAVSKSQYGVNKDYNKTQEAGKESLPVDFILQDPSSSPALRQLATDAQSRGEKSVPLDAASKAQTITGKGLENQVKSNKLSDYSAQQITDQDKQQAISSYGDLDSTSQQIINNATDKKSLAKAIVDINRNQSRNNFLEAQKAKTSDQQKTLFESGINKATEEPKAVLRFAEQINDALSKNRTSLDEVEAIFRRTGAVQGKSNRISDRDYAINDPSGLYADFLREMNGILGTANPVLSETQASALRNSTRRMAATAFGQLKDAYQSAIGKNVSNNINERQYRLLEPAYFQQYYMSDITPSVRIANKLGIPIK